MSGPANEQSHRSQGQGPLSYRHHLTPVSAPSSPSWICQRGSVCKHSGVLFREQGPQVAATACSGKRGRQLGPPLLIRKFPDVLPSNSLEEKPGRYCLVLLWNSISQFNDLANSGAAALWEMPPGVSQELSHVQRREPWPANPALFPGVPVVYCCMIIRWGKTTGTRANF